MCVKYELSSYLRTHIQWNDVIKDRQEKKKIMLNLFIIRI
jgi:hypothetical protein